MSTVIAVVGTIAGAGTTTVVTSLGTALGEQRRRVALVDATEEGSRIADSIDVAGEGELVDALRRGTTPADVQATGPHDVAAFPADPTTSWGAVRPDAVDSFYEALRERFEFVVIDCGCSISPARSPWLGHADEVAIVTDPDVAGAVAEPASLASAFDVPIRGVVANRVPHKEVDDALGAMEPIDAPVLGVLPEDPTVGAAAESGTSVLRAEPDSPIATCVWKLALRIRETDHDDPVVPPGAAARSDRATAQDRGSGPSDGASGAGNDASGSTGGASAVADDAKGASDDATAPSTDDTDDPTAVETETDHASEQSGGQTTDAPSPAEAGFEIPDPQPVDPAPTEDATAVEPTADAVEEAGDAVGDSSNREDDSGDTEGAANGASGDEGGADEQDVNEPERADAPDRKQDGEDESTEYADGEGKSAEHADRSESADHAEEDESADHADGDESAELSDDEIEAVFQETMQRVKERQENETDE